MSALAITAFVLALVLGVPAIIGLWWMEVPPLLLAVIAWGAVASGRRRGRGFAIAAAAVALFGGLLSFLLVESLSTRLSSRLDGLVAAVEAGDRKALDRWVDAAPGADGERPDPEGVVDGWLADYARVREQVGAYGGRVRVRTGWLGHFGVLFPPAGVVDALDASRAAPAPMKAVWFEVSFHRGTRWAALLPPDVEAPEANAGTMFSRLASEEPAAVREIRWYRPAGEAPAAGK